MKIETKEQYDDILKRIEYFECLPLMDKDQQQEYNSLVKVAQEYESKHFVSDNSKTCIAMEQFGLELKVEMKGYSAIIERDLETGKFHGKLKNTSDLIMFEGDTMEEVCDAFVDAVGDYMESLSNEVQIHLVDKKNCAVCGSEKVVQKLYFKDYAHNPDSGGNQYRCEEHKVTEEDLNDEMSLFKRIEWLKK